MNVSSSHHDAAANPDPGRIARIGMWLAVGIAVLLAYWPLLAGQIVFLRDSAMWVFPARWFVRQSLLAGEFPAWNPYQGLGFPLLADPQYGVFYPPHWLLLLVPDRIVAHLASWLSLGHLAWGGIGMMLLARRLGACPVGAAVAGISWALSGHTTSAWAVGPLLLGEAWIPWVARGFVILARNERDGRVPLLSAVWPLVFSLLVGEPFMSAMACIFAVVVVLAAGKGPRPVRPIGVKRVLCSRRQDGEMDSPPRPAKRGEGWGEGPTRSGPLIPTFSPADRGEGVPDLSVKPRLTPMPVRPAFATVARFLSAWLLAVVIAAVSWLPPLRMLESTVRAQAFSREAAELYSQHPLRVLEMVAPGALGDPTGEYPAGHWVGEPGAAGAPLFFSTYLGVVSFAFVLLGMRRRRLHLVLLSSALLALLIAFGKYAPVHEVWRRIVFPFAHMHSPEKYVVLVVAPMSLLAGLGASAARVTGRSRLRRWLYFAGALAVLALAAGQLFPATLVNDARSAALHGFVLLGLLLAGILALPRLPRVAPVAILALVALDLGIPAHRLAGFGSAATLMRVPPAASAVLDDNRRNLAPPRVYREPDIEQSADPLGPHATWQDSQERAVRCLTPNTLNIFGLGVMPGYASAMPELLTQLGPTTYEGLGRTLELLSMPYALVSDATAADIERVIPVKVLARPLPSGRLLRADAVLPRVYLPAQIRSVLPADAATYLQSEAVLSGEEAVLLTAGTPMLTPRIDQSQAHECRLLEFANARLVAECSTPTPNLAVFVEQSDSGWSATVDGAPAPVLTANLIMRAVPIPAGNHRIELEYHAPGLRLAVWLSCIGLLVFAMLAIAARRRPRLHSR